VWLEQWHEGMKAFDACGNVMQQERETDDGKKALTQVEYIDGRRVMANH